MATLSLETLYEQHYHKAYRICLSMVHNRADAEDLVQEAFVRVLLHQDTFRGDSGFGTWFHVIVVNTVRMHLRKQKRAPVSLDSLMTPDEEGPAFDVAADDRHLRRVPERALVEETLASLPPQARTFFVLHYGEGFQAKELAEIFGCSVSAAKSKIVRAKEAIKAHLAAQSPVRQIR